MAQFGGIGSHFLVCAEYAIPAAYPNIEALPCPRLLTEQILLTWRFIFILIEEAAAIHQAQSLRFGYISLRTGYHSLAMLVGMLFTRVMIRYQQMVISLDMKLYQGDFHL